MPNAMPEGGRTIIGWVMIGGVIALILLIMAILFGNLSENMGFDQDSASYTNETITLNASAIPASANDASLIDASLTSITMTNATDGTTIESGNYSVSGTTISNVSGRDDTTYGGTTVNVSYTVNYDAQFELDAEGVISNYTTSATNTSSQLPTTGTIVGIALLLLVLLFVLGFAVSRLMRISGGTGSSGSAGYSSFRGSEGSSIG